MDDFQIIARGPDRVGESPVWDARTQSLWWVDIESRRIRRWRSADGALSDWTLPERVACIALADDARIIAATESRIVAASLAEDGGVSLQTLARIEHPASGMRFNDGRCDPFGRLWVGTMVMDQALNLAQGGLYCLDERGLTGPHVEGLLTPNGTGLSPDATRFYLSDSHPRSQQIWAFDFEGREGRLSARRLFVDMTALPGRPDGAAVDIEGHYWICASDAGLIHRFSPEGRLVESRAVPFPKPAMCAFGGADMATLFVTSIVPPAQMPDPLGLSGAVIALRVGVPGQIEPRFSRYPAFQDAGDAR